MPKASMVRPIALVLMAGTVMMGGASGTAWAGEADEQPGSATAGGDGVGSGAGRLREDMKAMITGARDKVYPSLVNISVTTLSYWGGKENKGGGTGSGTIISPDGYVLTNQHVTNDGKKFRVTLSDKREASATLIGEDPLTDLAVIKIDLAGLGVESLPHAAWGESTALTVGETVMAMGSPLSLSRSVTLGIVSNTERVFSTFSGDEVEEMEFEAGRTGLFTSWIQHDALINPGNSGGPLVNLKGEIVGVNALGGMGIGYAIPSALARPVAMQLIEKGEVVRSEIGVALKAIKRTDYKEGVLVQSVIKGGPADRGGLKPGDLLLEIDGKSATTRFPEEVPPLIRAIAEKPVGSDVVVKYKRGETVSDVTLKTDKLLRERGDTSMLRTWGFTISQITEKMAKDRQMPSTEGVLITGTRGGGPADTAEPQLQWGDVIRFVDGKPVKSMEDLIAIYKEVMAREPIPEFVLIGFDRGVKNQVTLIKPRPDKKEDPPREIPKAWIGVATQPVLRDLAKQLGHDGQLGFRVTRVYPNTVAASSGLKAGDVIVSLNGEDLKPRTMQEAGMFNRKVRQLKSGESAKLGVLREGKKEEVSLQLERTKIGPDEALRDENKDFDLTVRELTFFDRDDYRWDESVTGVLVDAAEMTGWAGEAGVQPGDLIQGINGTLITDIPTYRKVMAEIAKTQQERVSFFVLRYNRTYFFFAEAEWKPKTTGDEAKKVEEKVEEKK